MAQVWLVTGSSRGLGHAIVEAGLAAGNKVLASARDIKSLADLSERYGDQVKLFAMDVTDEAAAANAVMAAVDVFGSLDVVINNAGYGNLSPVEDTPLSEFRAQIETNLFGTIIVKKAAQAIVQLTQERNPPLRLLLGSDAYAAAEKNDLARLEEALIWKKLSVSTDFETK